MEANELPDHPIVRKALTEDIHLIQELIGLYSFRGDGTGVLIPATTSSPCALIRYSP